MSVKKSAYQYTTPEQAPLFMCAGEENAGKVPKVDRNGYITEFVEITGGGEPNEYIKDITKDHDTFTATKKDGTTVDWTIPDVSLLAPKENAVLTGTTQVENFVVEADITAKSGTPVTDFDMSNAKTFVIPSISLVDPTTATSGTLTDLQLATLQSSECAYIEFGGEKFYLNDKEHTAGSLGYTYVGYENSKYILKNITITISTKGWVLTTQEVPTGSGEPANYIKTIVNSNDTITSTAKDDSTVAWDKVTANPTLAGTETDLTGIQVGSTKYKVPSGGSGGASIISKTYAELKSMRDGGTLVAGQYYRITDYVATTTQTNTQSANHQFDLIVVAISTSALSEEATAIQHSGDTYFANSNLTSWTVWYCLDNDTNRFAWADTTNGKGVIYYLQDEFSNSCWYDWKGIQVKNTNSSDRFYYLFDNSGVDSSLSPATSFPNVYGNKLGFYVTSNKFQIGCNVFKGTSIQYNTIGNNFYNNTIGSSFNNNTIGNDFSSNTIGNYFYSNTIGNYFYGNTIGNNFYNNTIGNNFYNNTIGTSTTNVYYQTNSFGSGIKFVIITDYGTLSSYKSGISLPNGYAGTGPTSKITISSLRNKTTYYIGSDNSLKTLD